MLQGGLRIGRLFGIQIYIDWSWIFIFLLITWNLGVAVFPRFHPHWSVGLMWGVSVIASLLFFVSVLAHELAHSLVANARHIPVNRITLFLFGGVSNIEREPPSAKDEFAITVVGPITSLVTGFVCLVLAMTSSPGLATVMKSPQSTFPSLGITTTLLLWLGPINILLGLFNLVPGFPLDGGRILRSILWGVTGNFRKATHWAAFAGQAVAWLMIGTGVAMIFGMQVPIFGTGLIGGLWLAFIGWFLYSAAVQSYRQVVIEDVLHGVPVSRVMEADVPTVPSHVSVSSLVYDFLMASDERAFPVMQGDTLVGLVTLEDVRKKTTRDEWDITPVSRIMTRSEDLAVARPEEEASEALKRLGRKDVRQMPVLREGRLVGILRRRDIAKWLQLHGETAV